ncbi:MAG: GTPase [Candidatus Rifleibacteriota bacterium]
MNSERIDELLEHIKEIKNICSNFPTNANIQELRSNLELSTEFCKQQNSAAPLVITLFGGTGTGKSYIFSKLCGKENLSPSSDSVRGYTKDLIVAADPGDRPFLRLKEKTRFVSGILDGAVLVDTPDIDSIHQENASLTQKLIEISDLIIYVASPDKRSNFEINETIMEWASRKRWLFVLNKADTASDISNEELENDFKRKIANLGFKTNNENVFVFSAREKNSFEFNRFKNYIFSKRNFKHNKLVYETACFKNVLHSLKKIDTQGAIIEWRKKIADNHSKFKDRLKQAQENIIEAPDIKQITSQTISSFVYNKIANSATTLFLFPYIWIVAKTSTDSSANDLAFHLDRAVKRNKVFKECMIDEKRLLKDLNLDSNENATADKNDPAILSAHSIKNNLNNSIRKILGSKTLIIYNFLGNLLPLFFTVQALTRAFLSWINGVWLPSDFFVHGLMLIAGSTLPGYMLFATGINRKVKDEKIIELDITDSNTNLLATDTKLNELQQVVNNLETRIIQQIKFNEKELENSGYGVSV